MLFVGIDPGSESGAIAAIPADRSQEACVERCFGAPSAIWTQAGPLLSSSDYTIVAALERVHTMPKQGISSAGKFMQNFGAWEGFLLALGISFKLVSPQQWQKAILAKSGCGKEGSLDYCRRKYPYIDLRFKKDHGKSDALCIAEWAEADF